MLLLLPPSEGKARPVAGAPVDLDALVHPGLTGRRAELLRALTSLCRRRPKAALGLLGLSAGQAGEVALDAGLMEAPAAPAREVYTGVLFERLGLTDGTIAPEVADAHVLIASALWGVVRPGDPIPAYRLSMDARLGNRGGLAAWWRPALTRALPDADGDLVVDLRSGAYAAAWRPKRATLLAVRAFTEAADGTRKPISHMAKQSRGDVARALLQAGAGGPASSPDEVLEVVRAAGLRAELTGDGQLDVVQAAPA